MNVLERIVAAKREEVDRAAIARPYTEVLAEAEKAPPPRGFRAALANSSHPVALIAEVKKASPVKGMIRPDFEAVEIARDYERAGANCLSVLTDREFFDGAPEYLVECRQAVELPVLRKDFIVDEYQVAETRALGADALLLIMSALRLDVAARLHRTAVEMGMDVLVEVHSIEEAEAALGFGANLVGINNRDLSTFETRLEITEAIAPLVRERAIVVSESALGSRADVERVGAAGARAVLIGTAFCREPDVFGAVRRVMGWD
jgi:indole-3-glycerol phosphate synthase